MADITLTPMQGQLRSFFYVNIAFPADHRTTESGEPRITQAGNARALEDDQTGPRVYVHRPLFAIHIKQAGAWRAVAPRVHHAGTWQTPARVYIKHAGRWRTVQTSQPRE